MLFDVYQEETVFLLKILLLINYLKVNIISSKLSCLR